MKKSRAGDEETPATRHDSKRLTARLTDDFMFAMVRGATDDISPVATSSDDKVPKAKALLTRKELCVAAEAAVKSRLAGWRHRAEGLFSTIAADLSEAAAQQVFADVAGRRQGRPRKTQLCLTDRLLLFFEQMDKSIREAATLTYEWGFGQSVEANEKRLQRLRRRPHE